jgi:hypothetical protein
MFGDVTLTITSSIYSDYPIHNGDILGIEDDAGVWVWSTTTGWITGNTIGVVPSSHLNKASAGNKIITYTNELTTPFQIYAAARRISSSKIDIPLNRMSYREYFDHPNKTITGSPTMWADDRQLNDYNFYLWPIPDNIDSYIRLIISRKLQDIDNVSETFDLPQEWYLAIVYGLAVMLAPAYGKAKGDNFANLKNDAAMYKAQALEMDNELGSIFIKPSIDGFRRP